MQLVLTNSRKNEGDKFVNGYSKVLIHCLTSFPTNLFKERAHLPRHRTILRQTLVHGFTFKKLYKKETVKTITLIQYRRNEEE